MRRSRTISSLVNVLGSYCRNTRRCPDCEWGIHINQIALFRMLQDVFEITIDKSRVPEAGLSTSGKHSSFGNAPHRTPLYGTLNCPARFVR